jgi:ABC-type glycerol-3-phosphate transport system substrate-binding protein
MKKMAWKTISVLLAFVLIMTACSNTNGNNANNGNTGNQPNATDSDGSGNTKPELYTIQIFHSAAAKLSKWSDTPVGKVILDKFNIDVELLPPPSGDNKEQLGLWLAGGNYPEIVHLQDQDITNKYIQAGALIALDPYLENMPNFTKWYEESIPYWRQAAGDGNLYNWNMLMPQDQAVFPENNDMLVRSDLLEQQGWKLPVSADEWIAFLKEAKAKNPKTPDGQDTIGMAVPFGESWGMAGIAPILYEKGTGIQISNGAIFWDAANDKYVDMFTHPDTKESFAFFNALYREGLIDEESFTDKYDQVSAKLNSGRALSAWYVVWAGGAANLALKEKGWEDMSYVTVPIQSNGQVARGEKNIIMTQATRPFDTVAITKNAKHPERILELVEFASSEEGQILLQSGIEGVHYKIVDGKRIATDEFIDGVLNDPDYLLKQGIGFIGDFGLAASTAKDGQPYDLSKTEAVVSKTRPERLNQVYKSLGWETPLDWWIEHAEWKVIGLASGIGLDQQSEEGILEARLTDFRVKNSARLIMAKSEAEFESIYSELVAEYNKLHPEKVVNKYNELYEQGMNELGKFAK